MVVIKKKTIDSSMVGQIVDPDAIPGADHFSDFSSGMPQQMSAAIFDIYQTVPPFSRFAIAVVAGVNVRRCGIKTAIMPAR